MIETTRGSRQVRAETSHVESAIYHVESAIYNVRTSIAVSSYHTECMLIYSLALRLVYCALHDIPRYRTQTKRVGGAGRAGRRGGGTTEAPNSVHADGSLQVVCPPRSCPFARWARGSIIIRARPQRASKRSANRARTTPLDMETKS